ncbi:MAG: cell division protein FtsA [Bacillota bacterium]
MKDVKDIIVAIDIGTTKIVTIIGNVDGRGWVEISGKGVSRHDGIKRGIIVDIDIVADAIARSVGIAEREANLRVCSAYVNLFGFHSQIIPRSVSIPLTNKTFTVTQNEIETLFEKTCQITAPKGMALVDVISKQFIIDQYNGIKDPIGMSASTVGLEADVIIGNSIYVQAVTKSMQNLGIKIDGFILESLAEAEVVLNDEEKEQGVLLVNVGGSLTDFSIHKEGQVILYKSVLVGGQHITNDLALVMKISVTEAEKIKRKYELALTSLIENDQDIFVKDVETSQRKSIKVSQTIEIIEARIYDIFEIVKQAIFDEGYQGSFNNIVLTGAGIHYMDGAPQMAQDVFKLSARNASWRNVGGENPENGIAVAMIKYISAQGKKQMKSSDILTPDDEDEIPRVGFDEFKRKVRVIQKKMKKLINKLF